MNSRYSMFLLCIVLVGIGNAMEKRTKSCPIIEITHLKGTIELAKLLLTQSHKTKNKSLSTISPRKHKEYPKTANKPLYKSLDLN